MYCHDYKRNKGERVKILLINAPPRKMAIFGEPQAVYPPLGILYIASYLRENGYSEIKIIDGAKIGFSKTVKRIKKEKADIIGISSTTWTSLGAKSLIKIIKKEKEAPLVVAGGPHATALPEDFLRIGADIVVRGEGERTFLEIVEGLDRGVLFRKLKRIDGIAFLKNNRLILTRSRKPLNVDEIPFPARELVDIRSYPGLYWSKYQPETHIVTSRGCPFSCFFCSNPVWKCALPFYRKRNAENIKSEIELLRYKFKIKEISDESDTFNVDLKWAAEVSMKIGEVEIPWKVQIRADKVSLNFARILRKNNCWLVRVGIESGNQETLDGIGKGIDVRGVLRGLRKLKREGINTVGLFMGFNVWELKGRLFWEDYRKTLQTVKFIKMLLRKKLLDSFSFTLTIPFPGSKLYNVALKFNLIADVNFEKWNQSSYFVMRLPNVKEEDVERIKSLVTYLQAKSMLRFKHSINPRLITHYMRKVLLVLKYLKRW